MESKLKKMFFSVLVGIFFLVTIIPNVLAEQDCYCAPSFLCMNNPQCKDDYDGETDSCGSLGCGTLCCSVQETTIQEEICGDGIDNDGDGNIDEGCEQVGEEEKMCDDPDGKDYYRKTTVISKVNGRCTDSCTSDGKYLQECICYGDTYARDLRLTPEGHVCKDGKFVEEDAETGGIDCDDSDYGKNQYEYGYVTDSIGNKHEDYCDGDKLIEYFCTSQGYVGSTTFSEEGYVCKNGALIREGNGEQESGEILCNVDSVSLEDKRKYDLIVCRESRTCSRYTELSQYTCEDENKKCYGYIRSDNNYDPSNEPPTQETFNRCSENKCIVVQGEGEDECDKDEDCFPNNIINCIEEGEEGISFNDDSCCEGLTKISNSWPYDEGCMMSRDGSFICAKCGDGICGLGENECNCPEDCQEEQMNLEGTETMKIKGNYVMLNERFPDENYDKDIAFYTGVHPTEERVRSLINFDLSDVKNLEIIKAELVINNVPLVEMEDAGNQKLTLHKVTQDWRFDKAAWNNIPRYDEFIVASNDISENKEYSFDITSIMDYLIEYKSGVLLKAQDENQIGQKRFDDAYLNVWYYPENIQENEQATCEEMGGKCRFLFGCRNQEIYTEDYLCPFWSRCCMPEQEKNRPVDLSHYPYPFIESNLANFVLVIGVDATAEDTIAATDILLSLVDINDDKKIKVPSAMLDTELANIYSQNTIIVGGPCVNNAAAEILGINKDGTECISGFDEGTAKIKLFQGLEGQEDNVILLVAGYDGLRTRIASKVLANYKEYDLEGQEVVVSGENLGDIKVTYPGEEIQDEEGDTETVECSSNDDCAEIVCPQVVGQDTPLCNLETNECYCGPNNLLENQPENNDDIDDDTE